MLDTTEGAQLLRTNTGLEWRYYPPSPHRIPFVLLGSALADPSLRLEMYAGRHYVYRLAPADSLEAVKARRL